MTQRFISLFIYKNHISLISKSTGIRFNQAIEEVIINFKVDDRIISDKHVESFVKYEYDPKKVH